MIHPLFNYKYLAEYVTFFDNYSNCCADVLEKESNGHIFDIKPYMARYVIDTFLGNNQRLLKDILLKYNKKLIIIKIYSNNGRYRRKGTEG